jgi:hypothetical protein
MVFVSPTVVESSDVAGCLADATPRGFEDVWCCPNQLDSVTPEADVMPGTSMSERRGEDATGGSTSTDLSGSSSSSNCATAVFRNTSGIIVGCDLLAVLARDRINTSTVRTANPSSSMSTSSHHAVHAEAMPSFGGAHNPLLSYVFTSGTTGLPKACKITHLREASGGRWCLVLCFKRANFDLGQLHCFNVAALCCTVG